jgi:hypothetical protein
MTSFRTFRFIIALFCFWAGSAATGNADLKTNDFDLLIKSLPSLVKKTGFLDYAEKNQQGLWPEGYHSRLTSANQFGKNKYKITISNYHGKDAYSHYSYYIKYYDNKFTVIKREFGSDVNAPGSGLDRNLAENISFRLSVHIDAWQNPGTNHPR